VPAFDAEVALLLADALAEGFAQVVTYTYAAGGAALTPTACLQEVPQPYIHSEGAEVRRRELQLLVAASVVTAPAKGDTVVVAAGVQAGTWHVIEVSQGDAGAWVLRLRQDDRVRMGTARRLP
jgi:hypothetical protein